MKKHTHLIIWAVFAYNLAACTNAPSGPFDTAGGELAINKMLDEPGLVGFVNDKRDTTFERLTEDCGVRPVAARIIIEHRDEQFFASKQDIEDLPEVGARTIELLYHCAIEFDYLLRDDMGFLHFINDQINTTRERLDLECKIRKDSADQIVGYRDGGDGVALSSDDNLFGSFMELDRVYGVGLWTLERLYACAYHFGYLESHIVLETVEFVYALSLLDPEMVELIEGPLMAWAVSLSDDSIIFPVRWAEVEILLHDGVPALYTVRFVQTIDPEGGIQVWYAFTLDTEYEVQDVDIYI